MSLSMKGDFSKSKSFLKKIAKKTNELSLDEWGRIGVETLSSATPIDTGKTANSWYYTITKTKSGLKLVWNNSNVNDGVNIALIIQYGHVSKSGVYIKGRDYINPALRPVFDKIAETAWREVKGVG